MSTLTQERFSAISSFLKVPLGKISTNDLLLPSHTLNNKTTNGAVNIILTLLNEGKSSLGGRNKIENIEIRQWLEYIMVYAVNVINKQNVWNILKEINDALASKTYLVAHRLTIADVFLYQVLFNTMENLPNLEKEKYLNVSRWFDNLQQDAGIRQSNKLIDFSTIYLVKTQHNVPTY